MSTSGRPAAEVLTGSQPRGRTPDERAWWGLGQT